MILFVYFHCNCLCSPLLLHSSKNSKSWEISWPQEKTKYFPFKEALSILQLQKWLNLSIQVIIWSDLLGWAGVEGASTHLAPPGFYVLWKKGLKLLLSHFPVGNGGSIAAAMPHQEDEAISQQNEVFTWFHMISPLSKLLNAAVDPRFSTAQGVSRSGSSAGAAHPCGTSLAAKKKLQK